MSKQSVSQCDIPQVSDILEQAHKYLSCGFSVIPFYSKTKIPSLDSWKEYQDRLPTQEELSQWFGDGAEHNIGIITGRLSGICVLDFDTEDAYRAADETWLPDTPTVKTGRGYHCYFKYRDGIRSQRFDGLPNVELKGEPGCIVAPPSIHPLGKRYEWVAGKGLDLPLAQPPEIILAKSTKDRTSFAEISNGVPEGERNEALARIVGVLVSKGLTHDQCLSFARTWNEKNIPPLPDREVVTTVLSIYNKHQREQSTEITQPQPEADILSCVNNIDSLERTTKETDWLVYGLFPRKAVSIIAGAQKEGKTWIALEVATALACGRDVFGLYPSKTSKVLFIEGDIPNNLIQWRLKNANYECDEG